MEGVGDRVCRCSTGLGGQRADSKKPEIRSAIRTDIYVSSGRLSENGLARSPDHFNLWRSSSITMPDELTTLFCFEVETGRYGLLQGTGGVSISAICKHSRLSGNYFLSRRRWKKYGRQTIRREPVYKLQRTKKIGIRRFWWRKNAARWPRYRQTGTLQKSNQRRGGHIAVIGV